MKDLDLEDEPFNPRKYGFDFAVSITGGDFNETVGYISVNQVNYSFKTVDGQRKRVKELKLLELEKCNYQKHFIG